MLNKTASADYEKSTFAQLVKVDESKHEVWTVVTAEKPDRDDEVCDYESTVPYYKEMVDEMTKASDGKNIFPLREMHGLSAAGKGIAIEFRDKTKEIYMGFKVVDPLAWQKVAEGVYTGVSQGGKYIKRWKDGDYTKYTAKPVEVSLVDVPCLQAAHFDFVRADGVIEVRKFVTAKQKQEKEVATLDKQLMAFVFKGKSCNCSCENCQAGKCSKCSAETKCDKCDISGTSEKAAKCACKCANCTEGKCASCSAENKCEAAAKMMAAKAVKYLVNVNGETHLPYTDASGKPNHRLMGAAWAALHGGYRGNKYAGPNKQQAIRRLKQVYAQEGLDTPSEKSERIDDMFKTMLEDAIQNRAFGQLNKGMYTVARFAQLTDDLKYLWMSLEYEREAEGDESPVTDDLKETFENFLEHLLAYTEEQVAEEKEKLKV